MAENTNQQQQPQQQSKCPGNCSLCNMYQRNYCASQISYTNMKILTSLVENVNILSKEVRSLKTKIETSESNELINPTTEEE